MSLKFCPKCGGEPIIVHGDDDTYQIKCWWDLSCAYRTSFYPTKEQAIAEWNNNNPMPISIDDLGEIKMTFYNLILDEDQEKFIQAVKSPDNSIVFCNAKAGTGKTTIAMGIANILVQDRRNNYDGIVYIVSPYGEQKQGFLPGTLTEKSEVYYEPAYQAMIECNMNPNAVVYSDSMISRKRGEAYVKLLTHTFLRGSNLANKVIIIDEAQNFTVAELKKVLTRIHDDSKVIVIGHTGQVDIDAKSGFARYIEHFRSFESAEICELTENHRGRLSSFADSLEE